MHWGADLNAKEQQIVYDWVREKRTAHVEAFAAEYNMAMNDAFISEPASTRNFRKNYRVCPTSSSIWKTRTPPAFSGWRTG